MDITVKNFSPHALRKSIKQIEEIKTQLPVRLIHKPIVLVIPLPDLRVFMMLYVFILINIVLKYNYKAFLNVIMRKEAGDARNGHHIRILTKFQPKIKSCREFGRLANFQIQKKLLTGHS